MMFPELSLTGYEPTLANELAMEATDPRLEPFQSFADTENLTVSVGAPLRCDSGARSKCLVGMLLFSPGQERQVRSKCHLDIDEEPVFAPGEIGDDLSFEDARIALAICYEISVPQHAASAATRGANIYLASVAKFVNGFETAQARLAEIARQHGMSVLMANCLGICDGEACAGRSGVWNRTGEKLAELNTSQEGVLVFDTASEQVTRRLI